MPPRDAAMPALFRHNDEGELATVVEAESEATLRSTRDLEEIARELRQSWERGEAELMHIASIIAGLAYPERRVLELCDPWTVYASPTARRPPRSVAASGL